MKQLLLIFLFFFIALSSAFEESRIVGGVDADIREFPYIVSIMNNGKHHCAGSLLNERWILTAAHCHLPVNQTTIRYGATSVHLGSTAFPDLFLQHENYDDKEIRNDIGLIRLKEAIQIGFHDSFVKIPLPGSSIATGTESTVAGWGIWDYSNMTLPSLQKANLKIWSWRDCRKAHEENPFNLRIYRSNICAAAKDFSIAECNGDSGGPMLVNGVQVGIVSWSLKPCGIAEFPGVYTAVSSYVSWIAQKTGIKFQMNSFLIRKS